MKIFDPVLAPQNPAPQPEVPTLLPLAQQPGSVMLAPIPVPQDTYTPLEFAAITICLASAATIGANMVDVQNGTMSKTQAVVNGLAKGAAASVILSLTDKKSLVDIGITAAALAGTGYAIDKLMKKGLDVLCDLRETEAP
ncbi:MAG: hypothetical protein CSA25_04495 [Desulfobacter postgatei]|uniref:Uncharacterized protein n=1 Tax=Desulfobacter postgatei TaxID=2293 RepID=A0A2G6MRH8_9BACT|nr:MAG: hypothetical protein CSA25_04495 [Desulfobacter postgatei]